MSHVVMVCCMFQEMDMLFCEESYMIIVYFSALVGQDIGLLFYDIVLFP